MSHLSSWYNRDYFLRFITCCLQYSFVIQSPTFVQDPVTGSNCVYGLKLPLPMFVIAEYVYHCTLVLTHTDSSDAG